MRKKFNPLILFGFFGVMIFILILNRPRFEDHPVKTKSNIAQVETQALHNIDKPVIDVSGWQRPEEINYDTLSQNISGAIVRVHSGAQTSKENDAPMLMVLIRPLKPISLSFKNEMSQLVSMLI